MDRRQGLIAAVVATLAVGAAWAKKATRFEPEPKVKGQTTLKLRSIDLARRQVLIEVGGLSKPPLANFFTFTDERERHFVAVNVHCDEPFPSGVRACELEIPTGYEKHKLTALVLHVHGLHGKPIEVDPGEVADAWDSAALGSSSDGGT